MKHATIVAIFGIAGLTIAATGVAQAQTVQLSIQNGRVTLKAEQATVRQILAEWERLGQVKVVGAERLTSSQPLSISVTDMPERQALDIVLRSVPGYLAVDRSASVAGVSRYDRLVLLPRTTAVASAAPAGQPPAPVPAQAYSPPPDPTQQAGPDRADVDQFAEADGDVPEPPMPGSPVINPYPGGNAGAVGNAAGAGAAVGVQPPETQFDYANPRAYFERMRQQQQQQQQGTGTGAPPTGTPALFPGSYTSGPPPAAATPTVPTSTPTAPGTLARPGIAPTPAQPPPGQGQPFNPYNLPPNYVPPTAATPPASNVEPDRSKYANPYVPATKPPQ